MCIVQIEEKNGGSTKVFRFRVLREGWECDPCGWIAVRKDGTRIVILTDHGSEYEAGADALHELMQNYQKVIAETQTALSLLQEAGAVLPT